MLFFMIPVIIFNLFFFFFIFLIFKKQFDRKKNRQFAQSIFTGNSMERKEVLTADRDGFKIADYLKDLNDSSISRGNVIIEGHTEKDNLYFVFHHQEERIRVLINPDEQNQNPRELYYNDVEGIILHHHTYTVRTGSGKNSSSTNYNHYYSYLKLKPTSDLPEKIELYSKRVTVGGDTGDLEIEARSVGEALAKLMKKPLTRIDGKTYQWDELDIPLYDRLKDYEKTYISLDKAYFSVTPLPEGTSINRLSYYRKKMIVIGVAAGIIACFIANSFYYRISPYMIAPTLLWFILAILLFLWIFITVQLSKRRIPIEKPLILLTGDSLLTHPRWSEGRVTGKKTFALKEIEEIVVRMEKGAGYTLRIVGDRQVEKIISYYKEEKVRWIQAELFEVLKNHEIY